VAVFPPAPVDAQAETDARIAAAKANRMGRECSLIRDIPALFLAKSALKRGVRQVS
jgi:predicted nucleic acid-binding protein